MAKKQASSDSNGQGNVLRAPAEILYAEEIAALIAEDKHERPPGWKMSPRAVHTYICGGKAGKVSVCVWCSRGTRPAAADAGASDGWVGEAAPPVACPSRWLIAIPRGAIPADRHRRAPEQTRGESSGGSPRPNAGPETCTSAVAHGGGSFAEYRRFSGDNLSDTTGHVRATKILTTRGRCEGFVTIQTPPARSYIRRA